MATVNVKGILDEVEAKVKALVADAKGVFDSEKSKIAADVRQALAQVTAAAKADEPAVDAALKKLAADTVAAVEQALASHGL